MIPTLHIGGLGTTGNRWEIDDPYWSDVILLLYMNGPDGGTTFTDSSPLAVDPDRTQGFIVSDDYAVEGRTSCYCDGWGGRLVVTPTANHLIDGDFTVETWARFDAGSYEYLFGFRDRDLPFGYWYTNCTVGRDSSGGVLTLEEGPGAQSPTVRITGGTNVPNGEWHHIALTREGSLYTLWLDGASEGTYDCGDSPIHSYLIHSSSGLYIGSYQDGGGVFLGYLDFFRITKACRYTGAFTPPYATTFRGPDRGSVIATGLAPSVQEDTPAYPDQGSAEITGLDPSVA